MIWPPLLERGLILLKKGLVPLLILVVLLTALNMLGIGAGGERQYSLDAVTVILDSMKERDDLHITRMFVSDEHIYHVNSEGEVIPQDEGDETVHYVSVLMVDASLPVSKIWTYKGADGLVVCLPPVSLETEIQEKLSFIWEVSDNFPNVDIEQKVSDIARKRAEIKVMDRGIKRQAEERAQIFFSQLFEVLGDASARVEFCEKSPSPLAES